MSEVTITVPLACGKMRIELDAGHCIAPDCGKSGGGMVRVTILDASHEGDPIGMVFCGDHLMNMALPTTKFYDALEKALAEREE